MRCPTRAGRLMHQSRMSVSQFAVDLLQRVRQRKAARAPSIARPLSAAGRQRLQLWRTLGWRAAAPTGTLPHPKRQR